MHKIFVYRSQLLSPCMTLKSVLMKVLVLLLLTLNRFLSIVDFEQVSSAWDDIYVIIFVFVYMNSEKKELVNPFETC